MNAAGNSFRSYTLSLGMLALGALAVPAGAAAQDAVAQYTAVAVNMLASRPGTAATPVNIVVNRWSTDAELDSVMTTLLEKNEQALLTAIQKMPRAGSFAPTGGLGFDLKYAWRGRNPDGTERVVLIADRPMSFWERRDAGRTTDYPFTVIELRIMPSGEGEGRVSVATRITANRADRSMVLENYNDQPVSLRNVRRLAVSKP